MKLLAQLGFFSAVATATAFGAADKLAGVVDYKGGFLRETVVKTEPGEFVKLFRVAIPAFCKGAEVLEASVSVSGKKDEAKLLDKSTLTYTVNGGAGQRIDSILLSFNGPSDVACSVPVYLVESHESPDPQDPGAVSSLQLCNRTFRAISAAVGYNFQGKLVSQGWWAVPPRSCVVPELKSGGIYGGEVYVGGQAVDGTVWGQGTKFCVTAAAFVSDGKECNDGVAGYQWRAFTKHVFAPGVAFTVLFQ